MGKEVAFKVEYLGTIDKRSDFRRLEMRLVEFFSGAQGGDQGPVVAGDDNGASASLFTLLDLVDLLEPFPLVGGLELLGQVVVTDTSSVYDGSCREDVLCTAQFG